MVSYLSDLMEVFLSSFILVPLSFFFWLRWFFVAARGLSLVAASRGHSSLQRAGFLVVVASLVAEHGF